MIAGNAIHDLAGPSTRMRLLLTLIGGLLIGLGTSIPLGIAWPYPNLPPASACMYGTAENPGEMIRMGNIALPVPCMPTFIFIQPIVWVSLLAVGAAFGLIAYRLANRGSATLAAILGGVLFLIPIFIGSLTVMRLPNPDFLPILFLSAIGVPFAIMTFGVSFIFVLAVGLALRTPGVFYRAILVGAVTALVYYLVCWILLGHAVMLVTHDPTTPPLADTLPDLRRRMGPMMKTTLIGNFIAGTIGGWITLILLSSPRHEDHS